MTKVIILPVKPLEVNPGYFAISDSAQSFGDTPGQALDALTDQLGDSDTNLLIVVQNQRPDKFFTAEQQERLALLMAQWRVARDQGKLFDKTDHTVLEALVEAELLASAARTQSMIDELEN
ncbi:MAG: hypothetical protein AAF702_50550 [Chloroflexota bacterium]